MLSGKLDAKAIGPRPELGRTARRAKPFGLAIYSPEGGVLSPLSLGPVLVALGPLAQALGPVAQGHRGQRVQDKCQRTRGLPKGASLSQRGGSVDSYHQDTKTRSFFEGQSTLLFFVPWCLCGEESDCGYVALCPGPPNNTTSN